MVELLINSVKAWNSNVTNVYGLVYVSCAAMQFCTNDLVHPNPEQDTVFRPLSGGLSPKTLGGKARRLPWWLVTLTVV
jgi:hypothetical protein